MLLWLLGCTAAPPAEPRCPSFADPVAVGTVAGTDLHEASGLAVSRRDPSVLWTHNDSGSPPRIYPFRTDGTQLGDVELSGVWPVDWEDMAAGPGPVAGESYLYVGDIGDNAASRESISVHRLVEPAFDAIRAESDAFVLTYPDEPLDAEALWVDDRGRVHVLTKAWRGSGRVFRASLPAEPGAVELEEVGALAGRVATRFITGADLVDDLLVVRTYTQVGVWPVAAGLAAGLAEEACEAPAPDEAQGEAIAWAADASGYFTVSEGTSQSIFWVARDLPP